MLLKIAIFYGTTFPQSKQTSKPFIIWGLNFEHLCHDKPKFDILTHEIEPSNWEDLRGSKE